MSKYKRTQLGDSDIYNLFSGEKEHQREEHTLTIITLTVVTILVATLFAIAYIQYA